MPCHPQDSTFHVGRHSHRIPTQNARSEPPLHYVYLQTRHFKSGPLQGYVGPSYTITHLHQLTWIVPSFRFGLDVSFKEAYGQDRSLRSARCTCFWSFASKAGPKYHAMPPRKICKRKQGPPSIRGCCYILTLHSSRRRKHYMRVLFC